MATVVAAIISIGLIAVLWLGMQVGAAAISRHRAEGAADLAALAAASHAPRGEQVACTRAGWVVHRMHARVASCRLDGRDARVRVRLDLPGVLAAFDPVRARARAGPVRR